MAAVAERLRMVASGRVQGVFFRASAAEKGRELGLGGYARNLADGTVEIVAEGERAALERLVEWARRGPRRARVDDLVVEWGGGIEGFADFQVR